MAEIIFSLLGILGKLKRKIDRFKEAKSDHTEELIQLQQMLQLTWKKMKTTTTIPNRSKITIVGQPLFDRYSNTMQIVATDFSVDNCVNRNYEIDFKHRLKLTYLNNFVKKSQA